MNETQKTVDARGVGSEMLPQRSHRNTLSPIAFDELRMPSLRLARASRFARRIARVLFGIMIVTIIVVIFAPWQQSITGSGTVVAYAPEDRQQTIEAPIKGRILGWGDGIVENSFVKKGDKIVEIQDIDPDLMQRLQEQLAANIQQEEAAHRQLSAIHRNLDAVHTIVESYAAQVTAYTEVKLQVIAAADAFIDNARQKVIAEEQHLLEQQAAFAQIEADYQRQKQLFEEKIASQLKFQEAERKYKEAKAKVAKHQAYVQAAKDELTAKQRDRDAKAQKAQVDIDYATALYRKSQGDVAKAESEVAKAEADLNKVEKELAEMQVKVSRQQSQVVVAPFDGFIVQIAANQGGQILKEGDTLCVIVPDTKDRAVQLWLDGNDAPLVEPGRHVRLQFEGWPAIQFSGWPSVAVGTFGGEVVSVDSTDNGNGQFRVLIQADLRDPDWPGAEWPEGRFLRQGVRVHGWVLLDSVPLWFEIWRRMNAFPPVVTFDKEEEMGRGEDPPKMGGRQKRLSTGY